MSHPTVAVKATAMTSLQHAAMAATIPILGTSRTAPRAMAKKPLNLMAAGGRLAGTRHRISLRTRAVPRSTASRAATKGTEAVAADMVKTSTGLRTLAEATVDPKSHPAMDANKRAVATDVRRKADTVVRSTTTALAVMGVGSRRKRVPTDAGSPVAMDAERKREVDMGVKRRAEGMPRLGTSVRSTTTIAVGMDAVRRRKKATDPEGMVVTIVDVAVMVVDTVRARAADTVEATREAGAMGVAITLAMVEMNVKGGMEEATRLSARRGLIFMTKVKSVLTTAGTITVATMTDTRSLVAFRKVRILCTMWRNKQHIPNVPKRCITMQTPCTLRS